jgi:hypothetical protein
LGQKKSMFDLGGRLGVVVGYASSTVFLRSESNEVLARVGVCCGGVAGVVAGASSFFSSFFLITQRLRPFPWTSLVSVTVVSTVPAD